MKAILNIPYIIKTCKGNNFRKEDFIIQYYTERLQTSVKQLLFRNTHLVIFLTVCFLFLSIMIKCDLIFYTVSNVPNFHIFSF